jgi:hypothetical protein
MGTVILPGTEDEVVLVVAVNTGSDIQWLLDVPYKTYLVSNTDEFGATRIANEQAGTAGSYIRFIIDNYASLPVRTAFINSRREWDFAFRGNIDTIISTMDVNAVTSYMPLSSRWYMAHFDPNSLVDMNTFLGDANMILPANATEYAYGCCNTFIARDASVQHLSQREWRSLYYWLESHPRTDRKFFALEFSWHVLFGESPRMTAPVATTLCPSNPGLCQPFVDTGSKGAPNFNAFEGQLLAR